MPFFVKVNSFSNIFQTIEKFYLVIKEEKKNFVKKSCSFVDSEVVETCHLHVKFFVLKWALGEYFEGNELKVILMIFGYFLNTPHCQP